MLLLGPPLRHEFLYPGCGLVHSGLVSPQLAISNRKCAIVVGLVHGWSPFLGSSSAKKRMQPNAAPGSEGSNGGMLVKGEWSFRRRCERGLAAPPTEAIIRRFS